ncbi:unnamed protein product [Boreogadus saida]
MLVNYTVAGLRVTLEKDNDPKPPTEIHSGRACAFAFDRPPCNTGVSPQSVLAESIAMSSLCSMSSCDRASHSQGLNVNHTHTGQFSRQVDIWSWAARSIDHHPVTVGQLHKCQNPEPATLRALQSSPP